ncbi:NAD(P)-dependent oxidoreductase, partial [Burkholderia multivorans]|uniref:NAD(P)-binding domain-containing protein n=1 Tax=Burkholderia multivorans TaxID=87883 RepID=UPI000DAFC0FE
MTDQITFLGLGAIGLPMALRLHASGAARTGVDPFPEPRERAAAAGLPAEAEPRSAASAGTVIVMVATGEQLDAALNGDPDAAVPGLLDLMPPAAVLIVM